MTAPVAVEHQVRVLASMAATRVARPATGSARPPVLTTAEVVKSAGRRLLSNAAEAYDNSYAYSEDVASSDTPVVVWFSNASGALTKPNGGKAEFEAAGISKTWQLAIVTFDGSGHLQNVFWNGLQQATGLNKSVHLPYLSGGVLPFGCAWLLRRGQLSLTPPAGR